MAYTRWRLVACVLTLWPCYHTAAQQCTPCANHCDMIGAAANASCVKSGIDPVTCGTARISENSLEVLEAPHIPAAIDNGGGLRCTSQGICYRAGVSATAGCMASCFICTPSTVHPDFLLISILYAPPGNASTASFGQSSSTGTTYSIANNISEANSTTVSITQSFASEGGTFGGGFSLNLQGGSSAGSGNSSQFSAVTTSTGTANLKPGKDPLDHTQDIFLLWLNPVVTLTKSDQQTLAAAITSGEVQMSVQAVSANQLMNGIPAEKLAPTQICPTPSTCYTLPGLSSLTQDDINSILAQDPFLNAGSSDTPDPSRFIYIQSNPLENTSVAANVTQTFTVSDAQSTTRTTSQSSGSSDGVTTGISGKAYVVGINLAQSDSWTWTQTVSQGVSSGETQQASVTLASTTSTCCGINNTVTCEVGIWEDMVYRTFAFVPQPETCQTSLLTTTGALAPRLSQHLATVPLAETTKSSSRLQGVVTRGGVALAGAHVVILNAKGEVLYRIVTDHLGRYFTGAVTPGVVRVRVGSKTVNTEIKAGESTSLNIVL